MMDSKELVARIGDLFNADGIFESMGPDEVDHELRDAGIDPEKVGDKIAFIARKALIKQRAAKGE
jgi:hypothetical protein